MGLVEEFGFAAIDLGRLVDGGRSRKPSSPSLSGPDLSPRRGCPRGAWASGRHGDCPINSQRMRGLISELVEYLVNR